MQVIIGSQNIPKFNATESAFKVAFPDEVINLKGLKTDSKVSSHPTTAQESMNGAINRVMHAKKLSPGADYYVGIEGGLLRVDDLAWEIGWVAIANEKGDIATGLSSGIALKGAILDSIIDGRELNDVLQGSFGIKSAGNNNGFSGLATNNMVTREASYEQGIKSALAQFLHPEYYH